MTATEWKMWELDGRTEKQDERNPVSLKRTSRLKKLLAICENARRYHAARSGVDCRDPHFSYYDAKYREIEAELQRRIQP